MFQQKTKIQKQTKNKQTNKQKTTKQNKKKKKKKSQLKQLQIFEARGNVLSLLPTEFCELSALTKCDLANNKLTEIPAQMYKLENLVVSFLSSLFFSFFLFLFSFFFFLFSFFFFLFLFFFSSNDLNK